MHFASPLRGLMWLGATAAALVAGAAAFFMTLDFDGTPYNVRNDCADAIYVDNGHDGLTIEAGETIEIAGFGDDLRLSIGRPYPPTYPMGSAVTFTATDVTIDQHLCP